jgi:hypothetical protein
MKKIVMAIIVSVLVSGVIHLGFGNVTMAAAPVAVQTASPRATPAKPSPNVETPKVDDDHYVEEKAPPEEIGDAPYVEEVYVEPSSSVEEYVEETYSDTDNTEEKPEIQ